MMTKNYFCQIFLIRILQPVKIHSLKLESLLQREAFLSFCAARGNRPERAFRGTSQNARGRECRRLNASVSGKELYSRLREPSRKGFTLIEVLAAVFILVLVIGSIWATLHTTIKSFDAGQQSMETYQDARVAMENFARDLRGAVSPNSKWTNSLDDLMEDIQAVENERKEQGTFARYDDPFIDDPSLNRDIRFIGTGKEVTFTLPVYLHDPDKAFDLQQVRFYVDSKKMEMVREPKQSIIDLRREQWRRDRIMDAKDETEYLEGWDVTAESFNVGDGRTIGNSIKSMDLRYYNGTDWVQQWDSDTPVEEDERLREQIEEEEHFESYEYLESEKVGLPKAVEILLTLSDGHQLMTTTEIPSSALNETSYQAALEEDTRGSRRQRSIGRRSR